MALIDDPAAWITKLFRMEERERGSEHCLYFPNGTRDPWPAEPLWTRLFGASRPKRGPLPLEADERVHGVYKHRYIFTDLSFIVAGEQGYTRLPWKDIVSMAPRGDRLVLRTQQGAKAEIRAADLGTGGPGRIRQLLHQLVERHGALAEPAELTCTVEEYIASRPTDHDLLPNVDPLPSVAEFLQALGELQRTDGVHAMRLQLAEDEPRPTVLGVFVRAMEEALPAMEAFGERFGADGVSQLASPKGTRPGEHYWHIVWD